MEVAILLRGAEVNEILEMKRAGLSVTGISNAIGIDRKTVRKYLDIAETPTDGPRAPRPRILDPFRPYIDQRLAAGVWNGAVLLRELRERGYGGGYTVVTDYLRPLRKAAQRVAV